MRFAGAAAGTHESADERPLMKKLFVLLALVALMLGWAGTALAADEELTHTDRFLLVTGGDIEIAADEQANAVVVFDGNARIAGTVNTLVVVGGTATVDGSLATLVIAGGTANLGPDATVQGDVLRFDATVTGVEQATVGGEVRDMAGDVAAWGIFIGLAALAVWVGFGIATLLVGLLVAGLAARQVRQATALISREPGMTALAGLLAIVVPPILAVLAILTVIGIPAGIGLLFVAWPAVAFIGYIVAAIWLGEWLLSRREGAVPAERPYAAATLGLVVAFVIGLVPLVSAILSIFGLGAVVLAALRTLRRPGTPERPLRTEPAAA